MPELLQKEITLKESNQNIMALVFISKMNKEDGKYIGELGNWKEYLKSLT